MSIGKALFTLTCLIIAASLNISPSLLQRLREHMRETIIYSGLRPADSDIYLFESPGKPPRRIAADPALDYNAVFSPDGKWLVFASERGGINDEEPLITVYNPQPYGEIWAVRLEDGMTERLTHNKWEDGTPTWALMP